LLRSKSVGSGNCGEQIMITAAEAEKITAEVKRKREEDQLLRESQQARERHKQGRIQQGPLLLSVEQD